MLLKTHLSFSLLSLLIYTSHHKYTLINVKILGASEGFGIVMIVISYIYASNTIKHRCTTAKKHVSLTQLSSLTYTLHYKVHFIVGRFSSIWLNHDCHKLHLPNTSYRCILPLSICHCLDYHCVHIHPTRRYMPMYS